jgi:hypothetical protein
MMFAIYFPVCLRVLIIRLVPEKDKGMKKFIFSSVNIDDYHFRQSI